MCEQCRNEYLRYFFGQRPPIGNPQGKNTPCLHAFALNWLYAPADADAADAFKSVWAGHKKCKCFAYAVRKNRNPSGGSSITKRGKKHFRAGQKLVLAATVAADGALFN